MRREYVVNWVNKEGYWYSDVYGSELSLRMALNSFHWEELEHVEIKVVDVKVWDEE